MDWFYNKEIKVLRQTEGRLYRGTWVDGTIQEVLTIPCDLHPSNREQIYKDYGYYIDCAVHIFCDLADIRIGDIIQYGSVQFKVNKLIRWDDYLDIFAEDYPDAE